MIPKCLTGWLSKTATARDLFGLALQTKQVNIKGAGKPVEIAMLGVDGFIEYRDFVKQCQTDAEPDNLLMMAKLATLACPAFEGYEPEEVRAKLQATVLAEIATAILDYSGATVDEAEDIEKKSEASPGIDSS